MTNNDSIFLDDLVMLGFWDSDGNIYCHIRKRETSNGAPSYSFVWRLSIEQGLHQKETIEDLARILQEERIPVRTSQRNNKQFTSFKIQLGVSSYGGKKIIEIFETHKSLEPTRYEQFLVFKQVQQLQLKGNQKTKVETALILKLLVLISSPKRQETIKQLLKTFNFNPKEVIELNKMFEKISKTLESKVNTLKEELLTTTILSSSYIIGQYIGDGSLCVAYQARKLARLPLMYEPSPQFIVATSYEIAVALERTLKGGSITQLKGCYKYCLYVSERNIDVLIPIFESKLELLPPYKRNQFERFKKACLMIETKAHANPKGWCEFVDLTYDMSHNHKRIHKKEWYIEVNDTYYREKNRYYPQEK